MNRIAELKIEIEDKKKEARKLLDTDLVRAEEIMKEVRALQKKVELYIQIEDEEMEDFIKQKEKEDNSKDTQERALQNVILPNEKFETRSNNTNQLRLDKLVRGMAGKGWSEAEKEREYYRSMTSAGNSTIIPQQLANKIIDVARTNSAIFGRIPTIPMESNNLTIAVQTKDPVAGFVAEGDLIPESEPVFIKVTMEGKTLAIFIPITEQLLDSAKNLNAQLTNICAKAIALALDKALLYGAGTDNEIKGIAIYDNINKITHTGEKNYDMFIKGIKEAKKANITPTDITYSTDTGMDLAMLKDSNGQYIDKPRALDQYIFTESNNVKTNEAYVYDHNSLLLGIHKGTRMEWGTSVDQFQRIMKGLRVYIRTDLAVINPKGITQITINE